MQDRTPTCPDCNGTRLQFCIRTWRRPNGSVVEHDYDSVDQHQWWCDDCAAHPWETRPHGTQPPTPDLDQLTRDHIIDAAGAVLIAAILFLALSLPL